MQRDVTKWECPKCKRNCTPYLGLTSDLLFSSKIVDGKFTLSKTSETTTTRASLICLACGYNKEVKYGEKGPFETHSNEPFKYEVVTEDGVMILKVNEVD